MAWIVIYVTRHELLYLLYMSHAYQQIKNETLSVFGVEKKDFSLTPIPKILGSVAKENQKRKSGSRWGVAWPSARPTRW